MIGTILHYLLAVLVLAATIVINASLAFGAVYVVFATSFWAWRRLDQTRSRRELGLPPPLLRYRLRWLQRRHSRSIRPFERGGRTEIGAGVAMEVVQRRIRHATFRKHGTLSVADGKAARLDAAGSGSSEWIGGCWVVYAHNKRQGLSDGGVYLIGKQSGKLLHRGQAQDLFQFLSLQNGDPQMNEPAHPLVQPPWRPIVREVLQSNDPERHRELQKIPGRLDRFVDELAERAEKVYERIVERTEAKYGPVKAGKLSGIQEIVMET